MNQLCTEFNSVFPAYSSQCVKGIFQCLEPEHKDNKEIFRKLTLNGVDGYCLPADVVKDDTSIFGKGQSNIDILFEDCDGIFMTERAGIKYLYICELKSTFSTQKIIKARDQIIGSYMKLHSLLSLLQSYRSEEWKVRGIITSFSPTSDAKDYLQKNLEHDKSCNFCFRLYRDGFCNIPALKCRQIFAPLCVPDFTIHYISVPDKRTEFSLHLDDLVIG